MSKYSKSKSSEIHLIYLLNQNLQTQIIQKLQRMNKKKKEIITTKTTRTTTTPTTTNQPTKQQNNKTTTTTANDCERRIRKLKIRNHKAHLCFYFALKLSLALSLSRSLFLFLSPSLSLFLSLSSYLSSSMRIK